MYNPENPYVFNQNYFENTTHLAYNETVLYVFSRVSFALSTVFSVLLIGIVVLLVIFKSPKAFKPYSKVLLICSATDFYVVLANFLCQMVNFHH